MNDVVYIEGPLEPPNEGQCWKVGFQITSVKSSDGTLYKDALRFASVDEAYRCLDAWKEQGWKGAPSSPSSFFRKAALDDGLLHTFKRKQPFSAFSPHMHGGWQEAGTRGFIRRPVHHYDINRAYMWSGWQGLPVDIRPWEPGDRPCLVVADIKGAKNDVPSILEKRNPILITGKDIDLYGLSVRIRWGVTWNKQEPVLQPIFERLEKIMPPKSFKHMTQGYWGSFAQTTPVVGESYTDGSRKKDWKLPTYGQHPVWASVIVHRIIRKLYRAYIANRALQCYVDSILCLNQMRPNKQMGGWSHEGTYENGVFIHSPGRWTGLDQNGNMPPEESMWTKHAGIPERRYNGK